MKYIYKITYNFYNESSSDFSRGIFIPFPVKRMKVVNCMYNNDSDTENNLYLLCSNIPQGLTNTDIIASFGDDAQQAIKNMEVEFAEPVVFRGTYDFYVRDADGNAVVPTSGTPDILQGEMVMMLEFDGE